VADWSVDGKDYVDRRCDDLEKMFSNALHDLGTRMDQFHTDYEIHHDELGRDVRQVREEVKEALGASHSAQRFIAWGIAAIASLAGFGTLIYYLVHH